MKGFARIRYIGMIPESHGGYQGQHVLVGSGITEIGTWRAIAPRITVECNYRKVSNISRNLVGNNIVDHSDAGAAPTTSSFST